MRILGQTGLVKLETPEEWERVRQALLAHGYREKIPTGKCNYLLNRANKCVTDRTDGDRYVELEALIQCGIEP